VRGTGTLLGYHSLLNVKVPLKSGSTRPLVGLLRWVLSLGAALASIWAAPPLEQLGRVDPARRVRPSHCRAVGRPWTSSAPRWRDSGFRNRLAARLPGLARLDNRAPQPLMRPNSNATAPRKPGSG
jgi:hypothetical protein